MASQQDFDQLKITIIPKSGRYIASMPQINLHATGDNIAGALNAVETKKQAFLAELQQDGLLDDFKIDDAPSKPLSVAFSRAFVSVAKVAAIVLLITIATMIGGNFLIRSASNHVQVVTDRFSRSGDERSLEKLESAIARAADPKRDLSDAKKQELVSNIRVIVDRWRPLVREASFLFADRATACPAQ